MSTDKPTPTALAASRVGRLLSGAEPVVTRIEFAPGHEEEHLRVANATLKDERPQIVEAALLKMNAAGLLYDAAAALIGSVTYQDARGNVYALGKLHAAVKLAKEAVAAAEGRSHQESA